MYNELIFLCHSALVASITLLLLWVGKEGLTAGICLFSILSNLLVTKQINLFGLETITTDVFTIGAVFCLNLIQEHFGKAATKRAITCNFILLISYLFMCKLHLAYQPNSFDIMQPHFEILLSPMVRITIASIISYLLSQLFDAYVYGRLKVIFKGRHLVLRNTLTLASSQLLDTIFFTFAALYGTMHNVWHIIIISYAIKIIVIACSTPFIALSTFLISKSPHHE